MKPKYQWIIRMISAFKALRPLQSIGTLLFSSIFRIYFRGMNTNICINQILTWRSLANWLVTIESADVSPHWKIYYFHLEPPPNWNYIIIFASMNSNKKHIQIYVIVITYYHRIHQTVTMSFYTAHPPTCQPGGLSVGSFVLFSLWQFFNRGPVEYIEWTW